MAVTTEPKFYVWMGDGWPGAWVIETKDKNGNTLTHAIVQAENPEDAVRRVFEAIPRNPDAVDLRIRNAYIVNDDGTVTPPLPQNTKGV